LFTEDELETHAELDLDLDESPPDAKKQIGIRFETFALCKSIAIPGDCCGKGALQNETDHSPFTIQIARYYEPYYVMIKLSKPDQQSIPPSGTQDTQKPTMTFQISNHTIPHWIPLRDFEKRYLNRDMNVSLSYSIDDAAIGLFTDTTFSKSGVLDLYDKIIGISTGICYKERIHLENHPGIQHCSPSDIQTIPTWAYSPSDGATKSGCSNPRRCSVDYSLRRTLSTITHLPSESQSGEGKIKESQPQYTGRGRRYGSTVSR